MAHAIKMGLVKVQGEDHAQAKLTNGKVRLIRELSAWNKVNAKNCYDGFTPKWLAKCFKVSRNTIHNINLRRVWRHI